MLQKFSGKVARNSGNCWIAKHSTENSRNSGEKFPKILGIPREVVLFLEILENAVPFATGSCRNIQYHLLKLWTDRFAHLVNNPLSPGILRAGAEYQEKEAVH